MLVPGMALFNALGPIAGLPRLDPLTLEVSRSLPGNPTTEMDLALWEAARGIRADAAARAHVLATDADRLTAEYVAGSLPPVAQDAVARFLADYGFRGVGEIDLGRPRWHDEPHDVLATLAGYVSLDDGATAPDEVFRRGTLAAAQAVEALAVRAREKRGGAARAHAVRAAAARVRILLSARERPKFMMVRVFAILRRALVDSGADLVAAGLLDAAEDVVFLRVHELSELAAGRQRDWRELVRRRRAAYERELRRRLVPRVMVGDGRTLYEGMAAPDGVDDAHVLVGSPVSPGTAEGVVRVVFDPRTTRLEPDEVLVCPGTDPAWTPLFLTASALVTEVGGMMTHGSVVAREYGIPAVVGVHDATGRLATGQRVRIDGSAGTITLLDAPTADA
jgi:pyruvate,water dikinase